MVDTKTKLGPNPTNRTLLFGVSDAPQRNAVGHSSANPAATSPHRSDIKEIDPAKINTKENATSVFETKSTSQSEAYDFLQDKPPKVVGKYVLKSKLGQGGMGSVWCATDQQLWRDVAIKFMDSVFVNNEEASMRFRREAETLASLRTPGIVQIFEIGRDPQMGLYLVMELLSGQSLSDRLESSGSLNIEATADVVGRILEALAVAHDAGVIHRDIKPDNVILGGDTSSIEVKLIDFGIAGADKNGVKDSLAPNLVSKESDLSKHRVGSLTQTGAMMGTPYYMSPEQARSCGNVDSRSDLWSVGVLTFECLLGKRPYEGDTLAQLLMSVCTEPVPIPSQSGQVPTGFDEWFLKSQERDPEKRFQSAEEMARALYAIVGRGWTLGSKYRPYPVSLVSELEELTRSREYAKDASTPVARQDRQRRIDHLVIQLKRTPVAGDMVADAKLVRIVGKGNYGTVWEASETATGNVVAVKVFDSDRLGLGLHLYHFRRGVRAMHQLTESKLRPESVIALGQVEESGMAYSMTYLVDGDLANISERGWSLEKKLEVFETVCAAVGFAHNEKVLHRDIKPANIIMHHGMPVLTDFDTADLLFVKTLSTQSMGSIAYAAPEQLIKKAERNPTGDIYSLGRLLHFFLIEDDPPLFLKESQLDELNSLAWPLLVSVIRQCTMYSPKERYQSIDELLKAFRKALIQGRVVPDTLSRSAGVQTSTRSIVNSHSAFSAATVALVSLVVVVAMLTVAYRYLSNGAAFAAIAGTGVFFLLLVLLFVGLVTGKLSGSRFERLVGKLLEKSLWKAGPNDKGE